MSCALTADAVRVRAKTVTRRHVDSWQTLKAGDRLTLIEKGMGLRRGERQVVLAEVEIVSVRVEPLSCVDRAEVVAEGFPEPFCTPVWFQSFWLASHGHKLPRTLRPLTASRQAAETREHVRQKAVEMWVRRMAAETGVRRIEWRYLDD